MINELNKIVQELIEVVKLADIIPNDNCILEQAVKIYISNQISQNKRENIQSMKDTQELNKIVQNPSKHEFKPILKASDKQLNYLEALGYKGNLDLSKKEAFTLIKQMKEVKQ